MTKKADFKQRVRARMIKTGESYATARSHLVAGQAGLPAASAMLAALHVSNGDCTDLPGTGLASQVVYWRDSLHEGPVPAVGPEELRQIRAAFLVGARVDDRAEGMEMFAERDRVLAANRGGEYVLWFEADLYDQLQIIQILARLAGLGVPAQRITLICIGEHPSIARFGGLGELTAEQLRELPATNARIQLTGAALRLATDAWAAFCAPTPEGLRAIAESRSRELRFLGEAFDRLSREYPSARDGLSLTERRILAAVADGAGNAGAAFVRAAARETRPYLGDSWCFAMMERMAQAKVPLLHTEPPQPPVGRETSLRLTEAGAQVLAGTADHVTLNGVDRWIGGVHLQGHQIPWRWDDATETITSTRKPGV
ncbi:hypothetical protein Rhe02_59120 [Rhizocola hellebori]|uniref:DUF1835 domain-containing protein n=1 Tax=Rhizocola hellebori TaxID=1392758 RepID=A0A8J3QC03_9ACTN|nr:hypothetical protein [Rhizocola hellebori]GIH07845.1 hypothetical protein Rhe02_59120 [Rhizocola hellebori]